MVRAARADAPRDYVVATGVSHTVRDFVAAAFAAAGIDDWQQHVTVDPRFAGRCSSPSWCCPPRPCCAVLLGWRALLQLRASSPAVVQLQPGSAGLRVARRLRRRLTCNSPSSPARPSTQ